MKKKSFYILILSLAIFSVPSHAAHAKTRQFHSSGEVVSVDAVYSQVSIQHGAIKDFSGDRESDFYVENPNILKNIQKGDLVEFDFTDTKGDVKINSIAKIGVALPKEADTPLGRVVQGMLVGTGEVAKGVTRPIAPAHEVVGGVVGVTTDATGNVLHDASPEQKTKF